LEDQIIKKLCVNTNDNQKALQILNENGFNASINGNGLIESTEINAIQQPELISALLVKFNVPPKMISVFEEDLEAYFLRMIKS
jgi:hypothetical protein